MFHLVYRSHSTGHLTEAQLEKILNVSNRNNEAQGITGILLYRDKVFLQLLEGDKETVLKLYQKISLDSRHSHPEIVLALESDGPLFKDWSMGHIKQDHINSNTLNHITPFLEAAAEYGKLDKGLIRVILKKFISPGYGEFLP